MLKFYLFFGFLLTFPALSAQILRGTVASEDGVLLGNATVINTTKDQKTFTDASGKFSLVAAVGDDVRFVKENYEREMVIVSESSLQNGYNAVLHRAETTIAEVTIPRNAMQRQNDMARLQQNIGLPKAPEKPRESAPPTVEQVGTLQYLASNLNLNNLYKNISGDARRMRSLYKYEDRAEEFKWIIQNIDDNFFATRGIAKERVSEFLIFAYSRSNFLRDAVKQKNPAWAEFLLDEVVPAFNNTDRNSK